MVVINFALVVSQGKQRVLRRVLRVFKVFLQLPTNYCRCKREQKVAAERVLGLDAEREEVGVVLANIEDLFNLLPGIV